MKLIPTYTSFKIMGDDGAALDIPNTYAVRILLRLMRDDVKYTVARPVIIPGSPPPRDFLAAWFPNITVKELAEQIYPDIDINPELPEAWVNKCLIAGFNPSGNFVWGIHKTHSLPLPLNEEAAIELPEECRS